MTGKTLFYFSGFDQAFVHHRTGAETFASVPMERVEREEGGWLFKGTNLGTERLPLEFVIHDGRGRWDNAPSFGEEGLRNYLTTADEVWLRDGQLYLERPPARISPSRRLDPIMIPSSVPSIPRRTIRVYLPRGYDDRRDRRYRVLMMHDGQNVFPPGGAFGTWAADQAVDREIAHARMHETIVVAIDNHGAERLREYLPGGERFVRGEQEYIGRGDDYLDFLERDVVPALRSRFRVYDQPEHWALLGSSMGGIISLSAGWMRSTWSRLGVMSPALWAIPNLLEHVRSTPRQDRKLYIDWGSREGDNMPPPWDSQDLMSRGIQLFGMFRRQGYFADDDVQVVVGCGHRHNEHAWSQRLPLALSELFDVRPPRPAAQVTHQIPVLERSSDRWHWTVEAYEREALEAATSRFEHDAAHCPESQPTYWRIRAPYS